VVSTKTSFKSLLALALLAMLALLAGCGGGGAKTPSCADTNSCPVATPPLVVNPTTLNVYPGVPVVLTISSGVGPFQVFSSDSTVLPVTQVVSGAAITMTANPIDGADRQVTITVRDAANQSVPIAATVKPAPLLSKLEITSVSNTQCPGLVGNTGQGSPTADIGPRVSICTGETGAAQIFVRASNTSPVQNRQVRFDVLQGAYNFALDQNGTTLAKTATILTDQTGSAIVTVKADPSVQTQIALIRATDVLTGNRVDTWFTIVQSTAGVASFNVSPTTATIAGYYENTCGLGSTSYVIYGGVAPYNVFINSVALAVLEYGSTRGQSVVVPATNGAFNVVSLGGTCAGENTMVITITDATGRVINAQFKSIAGTIKLPTAPDPTDLIITPPTVSIVCNAGSILGYTITGGTGPYTIATDRPYVPPAIPETNPSNGVTVISGSAIRLNQTFVPGTIIRVSIADSKSKVATSVLTCQ